MSTNLDDDALIAWASTVSAELRADSLWKLACYRQALYLVTLAEADARELCRTPPYVALSDQLLRAAGSVAANITEGYGRPTQADRGRFLSYALGSAREAETWYRSAQGALVPADFADRIARMTRVRRMLIRLLQRVQSRARTGRFEPWNA